MHTLLLSTISKNNKRRQYKFLFTSSSKFFFYLDSRVMRKTISRLPGKKTGIHVMSPTIGLTTSIYSLITQATTHSPSSLTSYFKTTIHTFIANHYSRDTSSIRNSSWKVCFLVSVLVIGILKINHYWILQQSSQNSRNIVFHHSSGNKDEATNN